jgi:hypothetical protein
MVFEGPLSRLSDFPGLDTGGANLLTLGTAARPLHPDGLQIGVEAPPRPIVSVRDIVAELRPFTADFASFSHDYQIPPNFWVKLLLQLIS